ncbi:hypothetical protein [Streptomyces malaysiensis]|uniref:hypothetical protein n=1 Tax=Streptomyces malaysiensis TaxID=92644 RepID=UPI00352B53C4
MLLAGERRKVALISVAAPSEHEIITTDPGELAAQQWTEDTDPDATLSRVLGEETWNQ